MIHELSDDLPNVTSIIKGLSNICSSPSTNPSILHAGVEVTGDHVWAMTIVGSAEVAFGMR